MIHIDTINARPGGVILESSEILPELIQVVGVSDCSIPVLFFAQISAASIVASLDSSHVYFNVGVSGHIFGKRFLRQTTTLTTTTLTNTHVDKQPLRQKSPTTDNFDKDHFDK